MNSRFLSIGLLILGLSVSSQGSDAEIDACATASDKMLCVAKVFNRKLDLLTAAVQVVSITYFDEPNCAVPWGTVSSASGSGADTACANLAEQVKNVSSGTSTIESVLLGHGACESGLNLSRHDSAAVISDCVRRLKGL